MPIGNIIQKASDLFPSIRISGIRILENQVSGATAPSKDSVQFGEFIDRGLNCVSIMVLFTYLSTELPSSMEHFVKKHGNYPEKR